ncbi:heme exporter protein CcmD [Paracoccus alkenifer]|uniref:Heme exporter protein D n=1 Tax=Paracoccus alkenifer TaxID=65735 RepID=A0A1H6JLW6_9RHOB|nr:heme exporter protein CcmD [Paracoccus alkenifer]SEH63046.1 heme exporter protein D [Paracoccus alkenifer]
MMVELGRYAVPVLTAWGISAALIVGLIVQTLAAGARARRALEEVERRG